MFFAWDYFEQMRAFFVEISFNDALSRITYSHWLAAFEQGE